jgi:hypothetical protein
MTNDLFTFNGINGADGDYLLPPKTPKEVLEMALGEYRRLDSDEAQRFHVAQLQSRHIRITQEDAGVMAGIDPQNLAEAGWGIIFATKDEQALPAREALQELLDHRREQATQIKGRRYHEYYGLDGFWPDDTGIGFVSRQGADPSQPVNPDKMPYYLLIVGDPAHIPYRFQYELDVQRAVGRICFETPDEYARYARSVVQAETGGLSLPRRAAFFGVANAGDRATQLSAENLVQPLADILAREREDWTIQSVLKDGATKAQLGQLLGGPRTPALLFTASHGMGFPNGDEYQLAHQGALLCGDWPGRQAWPRGQRIPPDHYFSADDVGDDARLLGLLAFHFACYGAGTPRLGDFAHYDDNWDPIAPHPFVARLPQRLLGHPRGGALAVVGHVDRAWDCSFMWSYGGVRQRQVEVFESTLKRLMAGYPVGAAMEYFNDRYAALSTFITAELHTVKQGRVPDSQAEMQLASLWTANNDARSYVIVGDPAVRLLAGRGPEAKVQRPAVETTTRQPEVTEPAAPQPEATYAPAAGVEDMLEALLEKARAFLAEGATVTVETWYAVGDEAAQADGWEDAARAPDTRLAARTTLQFVADCQTFVPLPGVEGGMGEEKEDGQSGLDTALLDLHERNVRAAVEYQVGILKAVMDMLR